MSVRFNFSQLIDYLKSEGFICENTYRDSEDFYLYGFTPISNTKPETLSWLKSGIIDFDWNKIQAKVVICGKEVKPAYDDKVVIIKTNNPRMAFVKVLNYFNQKIKKKGIEETAIIGSNCKLGKNVYIGDFVELGSNVTIGDYTKIDSHAVIYKDVIIGSDCIIHSGAVIGADGFGFEKDCNGKPVKFPHVGTVIIGDNVEVKSNTCINRGALSDTLIENNVKIDDLCHIGHNVVIGENTIIASGCSISGSVVIEKNCWLAPRSVIRDNIYISKNAFVGLGAVVIADVSEGDIVAGVPAKSLKK